jgi:hypothetical protein
LIEDSALPRTLLRIEHFHRREAPGEVLPEGRTVFAILAGRTALRCVVFWGSLVRPMPAAALLC